MTMIPLQTSLAPEVSTNPATILSNQSSLPVFLSTDAGKFNLPKSDANDSTPSTVPVHKVQCAVCLKQFASVRNLQVHQRIHTGHKPYRCSYCSRKFTDRSTLVKHIRVHTKEKPYKCFICESSFSQSGNLRRHQRSYHDIDL